jgi:hypothetical protein
MHGVTPRGRQGRARHSTFVVGALLVGLGGIAAFWGRSTDPASQLPSPLKTKQADCSPTTGDVQGGSVPLPIAIPEEPAPSVEARPEAKAASVTAPSLAESNLVVTLDDFATRLTVGALTEGEVLTPVEDLLGQVDAAGPPTLANGTTVYELVNSDQCEVSLTKTVTLGALPHEFVLAASFATPPGELTGFAADGATRTSLEIAVSGAADGYPRDRAGARFDVQGGLRRMIVSPRESGVPSSRGRARHVRPCTAPGACARTGRARPGVVFGGQHRGHSLRAVVGGTL